MKRLKIKQTAQLLLENDGYLILCHRYPDGDTLGSSFALCRALRAIGKKASVMCADLIPPKFDYLFSDLANDNFRVKNVICVDVADPKLLGQGLEEEYADKVLLCIDHHGSNTLYAENLLLDADAAATGEIMWEIIKNLGVEPDKKIAEAIYTAVSTDTGCFRYSCTTPHTMRLAADLMAMGIDTVFINKVMFETKSKARIAIETGLLSSLEYWYDGKVAVVSLTNDMIEKAGASEGDLDNIAPIPVRIEGVQVGVTLRENEEGFKVSVRTVPGINACEICRNFGGGGHPAASGCTIDMELDMAKIELKQVIGRYI